MLSRAAVLGVLVLAGGCASTRRARLYDQDVARVLIAHFRGAPWSVNGPAWIGASRRNADCRGEWSTVQEGSTSWGAIFSPSGQVTTSMGGVAENIHRGYAIVTCSGGMVIECEFVGGRNGHGACRDNLARRYRLMF